MLKAISNVIALLTWETETFAFAEGYDEKKDFYSGLRAGEHLANISPDGASLLVKPEIALKQLRAEENKRQAQDEALGKSSAGSEVSGETSDGQTADGAGSGNLITATEAQKHPQIRRFHGSVTLDALRMGRDAGTIAEAIVQHLAALVDSNVKITLEIHAETGAEISEQVQRTVSENCRTLKFDDFSFEEK